MTPFVVAGCPVRNRAWIIRRHLRAMLDQVVDPVAGRGMLYLVNDSADLTMNILLEELPRRQWLTEVNTGHPGWSRTGEHRYHDDQHANLAKLRNHWIDRALELYPQATHFWMVDSDVVPDPDCLEKLLEADKDIVAGVVRNGESALNFICQCENPDGTGEPERSFMEAWVAERVIDPREVVLVGACVLVRREVLEWKNSDSDLDGWIFDRVRFGPHPRGEDFTFCAAARAAGYELWVHPLARTTHYMEEGKDGLR